MSRVTIRSGGGRLRLFAYALYESERTCSRKMIKLEIPIRPPAVGLTAFLFAVFVSSASYAHNGLVHANMTDFAYQTMRLVDFELSQGTKSTRRIVW